MPWPMRFGPPPSTMIFCCCRGPRLALLLVGRIHVGGIGGKFGRTGVDPLVDRAHVERVATGAHRMLVGTEQSCQTAVGKAAALQLHNMRHGKIVQIAALQGQLTLYNVFDLHQEPGVDLGSGHGLPRHSCPCGKHRPRTRCVPARARPALSRSRPRPRSFHPGHPTPTSRPRKAFCRDSWKVRPIAITSPTDFICVVRRESACGNFSKAKRGILVTT